MPFPFLAAALITSAVGTVLGAAATQEQVKAAEKARKFDLRKADLENAKNARLAVAQRRIAQANILASQESVGTNSNSAVAGSVGALQTQTAANIGFANTQLAGSLGASEAIFKGQRRAANFNTAAGIASGSSSLFSLGATNQAAKDQLAATQALIDKNSAPLTS